MNDESKTGSIGELEDTAIALIRRARRSCEQLGEMGFKFVGLADWLELQVPRVSSACRDVVRSALHELGGTRAHDDEN